MYILLKMIKALNCYTFERSLVKTCRRHAFIHVQVFTFVNLDIVREGEVASGCEAQNKSLSFSQRSIIRFTRFQSMFSLSRQRLYLIIVPFQDMARGIGS